MTSSRIDFRALKEQARFESVLRRYGLAQHTTRQRYFIGCPFHREENPSCRIDDARKRFRCFGCGARGTILDFVALLERCTIIEAASIIAACCGLDPACIADQTTPGVHGPSGTGAAPADAQQQKQEVVPNPPLGFTLKLDPTHPYLTERGLDPELGERFGLGFCDRGVMRGRIAIPIHDEQGRLVAYAGRWAAEIVPKDRPRYLLPRDFRKQLVLYNLSRVQGATTLIMVESYWSVFRLSALGIPAISLMGRELSQTHLALLRDAAVERIGVMLDGDIPGRAATAKMVPELARHFFVRDLELPDGMKPHSAPEKILRSLIAVL
jgi:DNA primase